MIFPYKPSCIWFIYKIETLYTKGIKLNNSVINELFSFDFGFNILKHFIVKKAKLLNFDSDLNTKVCDATISLIVY